MLPGHMKEYLKDKTFVKESHLKAVQEALKISGAFPASREWLFMIRQGRGIRWKLECITIDPMICCMRAAYIRIEDVL